MTSTRANQYLINFRLEFFTNIGSRYCINLLNKDIQVLSFHPVMLITQHINHFVGLGNRFKPLLHLLYTSNHTRIRGYDTNTKHRPISNRVIFF